MLRDFELILRTSKAEIVLSSYTQSCAQTGRAKSAFFLVTIKYQVYFAARDRVEIPIPK